MTRIGSAIMTLLAVLFLAAGCDSKLPQKGKEIAPMEPDKPPEMKTKKKEVQPPPEKDPPPG